MATYGHDSHHTRYNWLEIMKYGLVEDFSWSFAGLWIWKRKQYITVWYSKETAAKAAQTRYLSKNNSSQITIIKSSNGGCRAGFVLLVVMARRYYNY
jgi:hypothetical protein